jgi:integrase/recombinase XerD
LGIQYAQFRVIKELFNFCTKDINSMDELIPTPSQALVSIEIPSIEDILTGQLAASSIAMYKRDVQAYVDYAEKYHLPWLDAQSLVAWRDALALHSEVSPNTINRMIAAVKRIIREMAERKMIAREVNLEFSQVRGVQMKALKARLKPHARTRITKEDMRRLCESPDESTLVGLRDRALLATLASSGVRASEASTLTREQMVKHSEGYTLLVCSKTDTSYRDAHLSAEAHQKIETWLAVRPTQSPFIFTSFERRGSLPTSEAMSEVAIWKTVQRYAKVCNLEHIKPHDFRRFVGTQLAATDIRDAQKALGHKSIEVTARHYVLDTLKVGLTDNLY